MRSVREMAEEAGFTGWVITARDDYSDPEFVDYYAKELERLVAIVRAEVLKEEASKCRYPACLENEDERCSRWLTGDCQGPVL